MSSLSLSLEQAENGAFAIARGLEGGDSPSLGLLTNFALTALSQSATAQDSAVVSDEWEHQNTRTIDSSARIFAAASIRLSREQREEPELLVASTLAFAIEGNSAAAALLGRQALELLALDSPLRVVLGVGCPFLAEAEADNWSEPSTKELLQSASRFCKNAVDAEELQQRALEWGRRSPFEGRGLYLSYVLRSIKTLDSLHFSRALETLPQKLRLLLLRNLERTGRYFALPAQASALTSPGFLDPSKSALVSLPTGAGKTVVGLIALASRLWNSDGLGAYVAPYLALRTQTMSTARELLKGIVAVSLSSDAQLSSEGTRLLVGTPESFDWRVRFNPETAERIRALVVDEGHTIGRDRRGMLADGFLTRMAHLRLGQRRPQLVLLSAVLDEPGKLMDWLDTGSGSVEVVSTWTPGQRRIAFWDKDGRIVWVRTRGRVGQQRGFSLVANEMVPPTHNPLPWANPLNPRGKRADAADENAALLAVELFSRRRAATLVIVGTRRRAKSIALLMAAGLPDSEINSERAELSRRVSDSFPGWAVLARPLLKGVCFHSAALPLELRTLLEQGIRDGIIAIACATTSLAEGADLPFGRCILADWTLPTGPGVARTFPSSLWRNIAGRCGRPSSHIEGETIVIEHTAPNVFRNDTERRRELGAMLGGFVRLETLLEDQSTVGTEAADVMISQSLAAIQENPGADDIHRELIGLSLSGRENPEGAARLAAEVERQLLDGDLPLATRNSPLALTSLGQAFLRCPVQPSTARALLSFLERPPEATTGADYCAELLVACAEVTELSRSKLPSLADGRRVHFLPVRLADLSNVAKLWLAGADPISILQSLLMQRGELGATAARKFQAWAGGKIENAALQERYEALLDFLRDCFVEFLPRALAGVQLLLPVTGSSTPGSVDLPELTDTLLGRARDWDSAHDEWSTAMQDR